MASNPWSAPTGRTLVTAVIGDPVRHSFSPLIHNSAFAELELDWVYVAFEVADGDVERALDGVRSLGIRGVSVTMPHKAAVASAVDELSPDAALLGAVNCVVNDDGRLVGHNTDGDGLVDSLRIDNQVDVSGRSCVVLGAGGAARSVILALARHGATSIGVVNRSADRAAEAAALAGSIGRAIPAEPDEQRAAVSAADIVINATSVGMGAEPASGVEPGPMPCDPAWLGDGQTVVDLIYTPLRTTWLRAAEEQGATAIGGIGMLAHQACRAFQLWTGVDAPTEIMTSVLVKHVGGAADR